MFDHFDGAWSRITKLDKHSWMSWKENCNNGYCFDILSKLYFYTKYFYIFIFELFDTQILLNPVYLITPKKFHEKNILPLTLALDHVETGL